MRNGHHSVGSAVQLFCASALDSVPHNRAETPLIIHGTKDFFCTEPISNSSTSKAMVQIVETEHPVVETNVKTSQVTYETAYGMMEAMFITIGSVAVDDGDDGPGATPPSSPDIVPVRSLEEVYPDLSPPSSPDNVPVELQPTEIVPVTAEPEPANTEPWYAVTMGKNVGVIQGWALTSPNVTKVSGACFTKHATKELAVAAFKRAEAAKAVFYLF